VLRATACIGFEAQLIATELPTKTFEQFRRIITVRFVQLEEAEAAEEDVVCSGKQHTVCGVLYGQAGTRPPVVPPTGGCWRDDLAFG